jgi:hypothetical protein
MFSGDKGMEGAGREARGASAHVQVRKCKCASDTSDPP